MYRPTDEEIGRAILAGRQRAGILQEELSERLAEMGLNWSRVTISKVERGERSVRATEIPALAEALDMDVTDLFTPWESGLQLRLRDAASRWRQLDEEWSVVRQESESIAARSVEIARQREAAGVQADALRVLIDFTRGAPETEVVSWTPETLVEYWTNRIEPPLSMEDLVAQLGEHVAASAEQGGKIDLEGAFRHVKFGPHDSSKALHVLWRNL